jgi:predicted alpha/beta-hydrolase family hydrolase
MRKLRAALVVLGLVLLIAVLGFAVWAATPLGPMPEADAALKSDETVEVARSNWIEFKPAGSEPTAGFIFYPGGRVDPVSYAPFARQIAEEGFLVVVVPMPLNLAVLDQDQAVRVIQAHPQVQRWAIGGHSLGGAMAASFVSQRPEMVDGLVLWGAYPPGSSDLSKLKLWVVSIYGSMDLVLNWEQLERTRPLLPPSTRWVSIEGGNHAQFGWYGAQPGDGEPAIDRITQQELVVEATVEMLQRLKP